MLGWCVLVAVRQAHTRVILEPRIAVQEQP